MQVNIPVGWSGTDRDVKSTEGSGNGAYCCTLRKTTEAAETLAIQRATDAAVEIGHDNDVRSGTVSHHLHAKAIASDKATGRTNR